MRNGFTLIEVLVALVLFEFGMLALAAGTGVAARNLAQARSHTRARMLATARVEQLRIRACATLESGTSTAPGGLAESWSVVAAGSRRDIHDSVTVALSRGQSTSFVARATVLCVP
jgi:prepilin-type N-terminal cleavage/methylation domain-containing protein